MTDEPKKPTQDQLPIGLSEVTRKLEETRDAAMTKAAAAVLFSRGTTFPALRYRQGGRDHYITAATLTEVPRLFPPGIRAEQVDESEDEATNRPVNANHVDKIKDYLSDNAPSERDPSAKYVLGPIIGTVDLEKVQFWPLYEQEDAKIALGLLYLPPGCTFETIDGQHRRDGIELAILRHRSLGQDAIGIELVHETDAKRRRLDFADLSKTKQIGETILSWFDVRDKLAELCVDLGDKSRFLRGRVERFADSIRGRSQKIYTMNQVLQACGCALDPKIHAGRTPDEMRGMAREFLFDDESYQSHLTRILTFIDTFAEAEPTLKKLVDDSAKPRAQRFSSRQVYDMMNPHMMRSWSGLRMIGILCARCAELSADEQREIATALGKLDWSAASTFWVGTLSTGKKLASSTSAPHSGAARAMLRLIVNREVFGLSQQLVDKIQLNGDDLLRLAHLTGTVPLGTFSNEEMGSIRKRIKDLYGGDSDFSGLKAADQEVVRQLLQVPAVVA